MYSFSYIKSLITKINDTNYVLIKLIRDIQTQKKYIEHIKLCTQKYHSVDNYIMDKIVNNFKHGPIIVKNSFPYYIKQNMQHMLLWSDRSLSSLYIEKFIENYIDKEIYDFIWFENKPINKSIKNIIHYHIILKKK
jgi:hypothetical protein